MLGSFYVILLIGSKTRYIREIQHQTQVLFGMDMSILTYDKERGFPCTGGGAERNPPFMIQRRIINPFFLLQTYRFSIFCLFHIYFPILHSLFVKQEQRKRTKKALFKYEQENKQKVSLRCCPFDIFSGGKECQLCASYIGSFPFLGHD